MNESAARHSVLTPRSGTLFSQPPAPAAHRLLFIFALCTLQSLKAEIPRIPAFLSLPTPEPAGPIRRSAAPISTTNHKPPTPLRGIQPPTTNHQRRSAASSPKPQVPNNYLHTSFSRTSSVPFPPSSGRGSGSRSSSSPSRVPGRPAGSSVSIPARHPCGPSPGG